MKQPAKKAKMLLLAVVCMLLLSGSLEAQAADMKSSTSGITWGVQTNKTYNYYSYWGGVGMIRQNFRITNWKDAWSGNRGMRRLSFTITFIRKKRPTARQLRKAATYYTIQHPELSSTSPRCYYTVVDYATGMSLEDPANPYGVMVSNSGWRQSTKTTYRTKGYSISMTNTSVNVSIEYPYTYKGLCIGIGGTTSLFETSSDKLFWDGIYPFWMTDTLRSVKKKKIARFGRWWYD